MINIGYIIAASTNDHTLILIAIISNFTLLLVTGLNTYFGHKAAKVPAALNKLEITLDGKLDKLSRAETGQARAEGIIEGANKEQERVAAAKVEEKKPDEKVTKMEIVSGDENPVTTRPAKSVPSIQEKEQR